MSLNKELESKLIVGTKIRIGEQYAQKIGGYIAGDVIELVEGYFDYDNGLYCETQTAPAVWCEAQHDYDSIYHLFGNDLENFMDCKIEGGKQ